jgi:hypothetical protein
LLFEEDEERAVNVAQLYIPTLPEEIKNLFSESKRNCLLVFQHNPDMKDEEESVIKLCLPKDYEKPKHSRGKLIINLT